MNSITLNQEELQALNQFINEIPTKYGIFLINTLNSAARRNEQEKQAADDAAKTVVPPSAEQATA
jgi:hypothetical protein